MNGADRAQWRKARTLPELGEMYARWLLRDVGSQPNWIEGDGPSLETEPLIPTLVALNRAGFVTFDSQPGAEGRHGGSQRAAVQGYADTVTLGRLADELADTRFQVHATTFIGVRDFDPFAGFAAFGVPVSLSRGEPVTWFGTQLSRSALRSIYEGNITAAMIDTICAAWSVTVFDPIFDSNDLWPALDRAAAHLNPGLENPR